MAFTARILFNGLCAFVPNTEESRGMRVLLIDGRAPGLAPNGKGHVSHVPAVRFRAMDLVADRKQPAFRYDYSSQDPEPRGAWMLNGDDLELRVDGEPLPPGPLCIRRDGTDLDFDGVPSMRDIYPDRGGIEVLDACLDNDLTRLSDAGLVARIRLHGGEVGVYPGDGKRCFLSAEEYVFTGSPSGERHRLAACAYFDVEIEGESLEVYSRQRGHGPVFRPADGERLELMIENEPPMDLMGSKPDDSSIDYDFELLYRVAKDLPPEPRLPMLAVAAVSQGGQRALSVHASRECDSVQYNDSEEANGQHGTRECDTVQYNDSEEALGSHDQRECDTVQYNDSTEASVPHAIEECVGVQYDPSAEADGAHNNRECDVIRYNPSREAVSPHSMQLCSPVQYDPTSEADVRIDREACPSLAYNPSEEAGILDRPICPLGGYNPSEEASGFDRPLCPFVGYNPSSRA